MLLPSVIQQADLLVPTAFSSSIASQGEPSMKPIATAWTRLRTDLMKHKAELRLTVRVTVAVVLTLAIGERLNVPLVLWAVLTAVIVTQSSVGRSVKATIDYCVGTLGGAIYAGAVAALIPHDGELARLAVLAIAVAPLVLLASVNSSFSVAPFTAIIVVLAPTITHSTPVESALYRLMEVGLGVLVGLLVSLTVFPARAHGLAIEAAARMLELVAQAIQDMFAGFTGALDTTSILPIQERIGKAIAQLDVINAEVQRERVSQLSREPDPGPLLRTLLRLRHDLVIVGRAAVVPLPQALQPRLAPPLDRLVAASADYLRGCAAALVTRTVAPSLATADAGFDAYAAEIAAIRAEGLMWALPGEALEHLFTLGFALEQLHQHFRDLEQWVTVCARPAKVALRDKNG
jgi:uncharacterized membrane protein YccC